MRYIVYLALHVDISFAKCSHCQNILLLQRNELFKRKVEVARHLRILSFFLEHALKENDLSRVLSMDTENANGGFSNMFNFGSGALVWHQLRQNQRYSFNL